MATLLIVTLGLVLAGALLGIVIRGASREDVLSRFAQDHGLERWRENGSTRVEGRYRGRRLSITQYAEASGASLRVEVPFEGLELPASHLRASGAPAVADDEPAHDDLEPCDSSSSDGAERPELLASDAAAFDAFLSQTESGERARELLSAEPRLRLHGPSIAYVADEPVRRRRRLEELADRMVRSARHVDGVT